MQELVAGILRAMGYKTRISPKGADRGKDIIASPDGLGLENPKIVVEVKHRQGSMGSPEVRSFLGGLRPSDKGLYISTGGFSKDAKYEAERANIPITLVDSDILVELIIQYYDSFDNDTKTLVPLKKIYWPIR
jgi:restriction system protein